MTWAEKRRFAIVAAVALSAACLCGSGLAELRARRSAERVKSLLSVSSAAFDPIATAQLAADHKEQRDDARLWLFAAAVAPLAVGAALYGSRWAATGRWRSEDQTAPLS